jgi:hypothetical protein
LPFAAFLTPFWHFLHVLRQFCGKNAYFSRFRTLETISLPFAPFCAFLGYLAPFLPFKAI